MMTITVYRLNNSETLSFNAKEFKKLHCLLISLLFLIHGMDHIKSFWNFSSLRRDACSRSGSRDNEDPVLWSSLAVIPKGKFLLQTCHDCLSIKLFYKVKQVGFALCVWPHHLLRMLLTSLLCHIMTLILIMSSFIAQPS